MTGPWTLNPDTGEWLLNEPYKTKLAECKRSGSEGWQRGVYGYLAENTMYDVDTIHREFARRIHETGLSPIEIVDEFIIEALDGDL